MGLCEGGQKRKRIHRGPKPYLRGYLGERYVNLIYALVAGHSVFGKTKLSDIWDFKPGVDYYVTMILESLPGLKHTDSISNVFFTGRFPKRGQRIGSFGGSM
jgi:hypothetical protein